MPSVSFVLAEREHRRYLQQFVCTDPPAMLYDRHRGNHHPSKWELDAQSIVRDLQPPVTPTEVIALGMVDGEIGSVTNFCFSADEPRQYVLRVIACRADLRGAGLGGATLDFTLQVLAYNNTQRDAAYGVFTRVHTSNEASKALLRSRGFEAVGSYHQRMETWVHDLLDVDLAIPDPSTASRQ